MAGLDVNRGAKRAREARAAFGLDRSAPLRCLLDVVEAQTGLAIVVAPLVEGLAGACVAFGSGGRLLFVNGAQATVRQRFTLAHELGHVRCGHDGALAVDTFATLSGATTNVLEVQANAFAAEFLLPASAVDEVLDGDPGLDELVVTASAFGGSALMTLFRVRPRISEAAFAALEAAIGDGLHLEAAERLGLPGPPDRLGELEALPYLSPALHATRLGAVLRGDAPAEGALATAIARLLSSPGD